MVIDAYSKWPEVIEMSTGPSGVSAARTIEELRRIFTVHGLLHQIVSDNGPQFVSDQFAQFLKQNSIKHFRSSPYHPATNGLSERFIQTLKKSLELAMMKELYNDWPVLCLATAPHLMPPQKKSHVSC